MLLFEGIVLMGYEILASRYLHPFFGSGIDTWACIISTVLLAMMCGYFLGGHVADRAGTTDFLTASAGIASGCLIFTALFGRDALLWMVDTFDHGPLALMTGAVLVLFVPVLFLSVWSPFLVRVILRRTTEGGRVVGAVYGVSTLGNVVGALSTAFLFIPTLGTFAITMSFAVALLGLAATTLLLRSGTRSMMARASASPAVIVGLCLFAAVSPGKAEESFEADYPEGVLFAAGGDLYFTEMAAGRVRVISGQKDRVFWQSTECGPTGIAEIGGGRFAIACHLTPSIVILDANGKFLRRLTRTASGKRLHSPNAISGDGAGGAYFSDSGVFHPDAPATGNVYHLSAAMVVSPVLSRLHYANGVSFDRDRRTLYVSEHLARRVLRLPVETNGLSGTATVEFDFRKDGRTAHLMYGFAGPDGLRVLPDGSLIIALYGTGRVAYLTTCRELALFNGFNQYVTSVDVSNGMTAVASAVSNAAPPFGGDVRLIELNPPTGCEAQ